jgi:hypothetical protein
MPKAGKYKWLPQWKGSPTLAKLKLKNARRKRLKKRKKGLHEEEE